MVALTRSHVNRVEILPDGTVMEVVPANTRRGVRTNWIYPPDELRWSPRKARSTLSPPNTPRNAAGGNANTSARTQPPPLPRLIIPPLELYLTGPMSPLSPLLSDEEMERAERLLAAQRERPASVPPRPEPGSIRRSSSFMLSSKYAWLSFAPDSDNASVSGSDLDEVRTERCVSEEPSLASNSSVWSASVESIELEVLTEEREISMSPDFNRRIPNRQVQDCPDWWVASQSDRLLGEAVGNLLIEGPPGTHFKMEEEADQNFRQ